jgi:hypothetical protein
MESSRRKLYIDEDAMYKGLATALRAHGIAVITALDAGLINSPDEQHLAFRPTADVRFTVSTDATSSDSIRYGSARAGSMGVSSWDTNNGFPLVNSYGAFCA